MNNSYRTSSASSIGDTHHQWARIKQHANVLGYLGLIPFVLLPIGMLVLQSEFKPQIGEALVAYGAVIISFLGAHHWTLSVSGASHKNMLYAVTPALIGWIAILMPVQYGMLTVLIGLLITWYADNKLSAMDAWYLVLRNRLTFVAVSSISIAIVSFFGSI